MRWAVVAAAALAAGCLLAPQPPVLPARGPGEVFATVDDAALDALRYAYRLSLRQRQVEYGGAVRRVDGGFTYDAPVRGAEEDVTVRLGPDAVAWFHTHSRAGSSRVDRLNEQPSPRDREMVDRVDPLHRPLYIRTPGGRFIVYRNRRVSRLDGPATWIARPEEGPIETGS